MFPYQELKLKMQSKLLCELVVEHKRTNCKVAFDVYMCIAKQSMLFMTENIKYIRVKNYF